MVTEDGQQKVRRYFYDAMSRKSNGVPTPFWSFTQTSSLSGRWVPAGRSYSRVEIPAKAMVGDHAGASEAWQLRRTVWTYFS